MEVRRVVTGRTPEGRSVIAADERVGPVTLNLLPGTEFHTIWGADEPVRLHSGGSAHDVKTWFPPPGGFRFAFFTLAPATAAVPEDLDMNAALAEFEQKVPGLAATLESEDPAMHTSDTIDFQFVVSGEVWLEVDDGAEVHLSAGDCVVQNGTRHAWRNRSSEPCVMAVALIGASRDAED